MSKQSRSKSNGAREPKRGNHDQLDGRVKILYESSGHYGGWTMEEMAAAGMGPVYPKREPEPDRPDDLKELAADLDIALLAFDEADQAWQQAATATRIGRNGPLLVSFDYTPAVDSMNPNRMMKLERTERDKWVIRKETGDELRAAKIAFSAADKAWQRARRQEQAK